MEEIQNFADSAKIHEQLKKYDLILLVMGKNEISIDRAFSKERFILLAKSEFLMNRSNYLKLAIGTIAVFVAIAIIVSINAIHNIGEFQQLNILTDRDFDWEISQRRMNYAGIYMGICGWIVSLGMTVFGSLTFVSMSSKKRRISTLMLPASLPEKFTLFSLIYLVGGMILLLIGFLVGIGVIQIAFGGGEWIKLNSSDFFDHGNTARMVSISLFLLSLFVYSLYALGSSLWPRLSWLKTWIIVSFVEWILAIFLITGILSGFGLEEFVENTIKTPSYQWTIIVTLIVLITCCWILAWHRFRNTQIVQRFMKK